MSRAVQVQKHSHQRSSFSFTAVPATSGSLFGQSRFLKNDPSPGIGKFKPVLLGREVVEVLDGKIWVSLASQLSVHRGWLRPAAACGVGAGAVITQSTPSPLLVALLEPADVPRGDAQNVRCLQPAQLSLDRFENDVFPRHCFRLPGDPAFDAFHRTTLAQRKRTSLSAYPADISTAPYTALLRRLTRAGTARKEPFNLCGSSSAGRARASQARGRGFDPRLPLFLVLIVVRFSDPILLTLELTRLLTRSAGLGSALNKERGHAEDTVWAGFDFGVRFVVRHGRGEGTWH